MVSGSLSSPTRQAGSRLSRYHCSVSWAQEAEKRVATYANLEAARCVPFKHPGPLVFTSSKLVIASRRLLGWVNQQLRAKSSDWWLGELNLCFLWRVKSKWETPPQPPIQTTKEWEAEKRVNKNHNLESSDHPSGGIRRIQVPQHRVRHKLRMRGAQTRGGPVCQEPKAGPWAPESKRLAPPPPPQKNRRHLLQARKLPKYPQKSQGVGLTSWRIPRIVSTFC